MTPSGSNEDARATTTVPVRRTPYRAASAYSWTRSPTPPAPALNPRRHDRGSHEQRRSPLAASARTAAAVACLTTLVACAGEATHPSHQPYCVPISLHPERSPRATCLADTIAQALLANGTTVVEPSAHALPLSIRPREHGEFLVQFPYHVDPSSGVVLDGGMDLQQISQALGPYVGMLQREGYEHSDGCLDQSGIALLMRRPRNLEGCACLGEPRSP